MGIILGINYWFQNQGNIKINTALNEPKDLGQMKLDLINDEEFIRFIMINHVHEATTSIKIRNLLVNLSNLSTQNNQYKISRANFNQAYRELYGEDAKDINFNNLRTNLDITEKDDFVYFAADIYSNNDNLVFVGIKSLTQNGNNLVADTYIYDTYTNDPEEEAQMIKAVKTIIIENGYLNEDLIQKYNFNVNQKNITFKKLPQGEYFKYQIAQLNLLPDLDEDEENLIDQETLSLIYLVVGILGFCCIPFLYFKIKNSNPL